MTEKTGKVRKRKCFFKTFFVLCVLFVDVLDARMFWMGSNEDRLLGLGNGNPWVGKIILVK